MLYLHIARFIKTITKMILQLPAKKRPCITWKRISRKSRHCSLLTASSDDIDSHLAATDLLATQSFTHQKGGTLWHFRHSSSDIRPQEPIPDQKENINLLNNYQLILDTAQREVKLIRWKLFAYWWSFVSSRQ